MRGGLGGEVTHGEVVVREGLGGEVTHGEVVGTLVRVFTWPR